MELDPVILSRIQFAFVVSFHIIFPAFTIGLAAWLATIEGMRLATGNPVYRKGTGILKTARLCEVGTGTVAMRISKRKKQRDQTAPNLD